MLSELVNIDHLLLFHCTMMDIGQHHSAVKVSSVILNSNELMLSELVNIDLLLLLHCTMMDIGQHHSHRLERCWTKLVFCAVSKTVNPAMVMQNSWVRYDPF